jgi:hypothetical protein
MTRVRTVALGRGASFLVKDSSTMEVKKEKNKKRARLIMFYSFFGFISESSQIV